MIGDILDIVLAVLAIAFGVSGYRQGFIVGVLSLGGFIAGGILGAVYAPGLVRSLMGGGRGAALVALTAVFILAVLGQFLTSSLGMLIRRHVTWRPARLVDALGGAVASIVSLLLIAWLLGSAMSGSSFPVVSHQVRNSQILRSVDRVVPDITHTWFAALRELVDQRAFPQVFGGLTGGPAPRVPPPKKHVLADEVLRTVRHSVVKVMGVAPGCHRSTEGSGFVYAPRHVLTNAHVVAGVRRGMTVTTAGGRSYNARVVLFDPRDDIAVLYVPDLPLPDLDFAERAESGASAVIAGYPHGGDFSTVPARVRGYQKARGPGIYQTHRVTRSIYTLRARVKPGNSGGPLVAPDGEVYGVVFAASVEHPDTGYALTADEVLSEARKARDDTEAVSTMMCR